MKHGEKKKRIFISCVCVGGMIILPFLQTGLGLYVGIVEVLILVVFGFSVGPIIGELLGKGASGLYFGAGRHELVPLLSEAESAMKRGDFVRAVELYRAVQVDFPAYIPLYQPLFELLAHRNPDREQLRAVYRIGWNAMQGEDRRRLEHLFQQFIH